MREPVKMASSLAIDGKDASTRQGTLIPDTDSGRMNIRFGLNDYFGISSATIRTISLV